MLSNDRPTDRRPLQMSHAQLEATEYLKVQLCGRHSCKLVLTQACAHTFCPISAIPNQGTVSFVRWITSSLEPIETPSR